MTQFKGQGSFWDLAAFTERIMQMLEPRIEESFERLVQGSLDRQSIAWTNMQVLKHHEYRDQRERREHRQQRRFVGNQDVPDPTIPPGGAVNDLRVELNEVKVALNQVLKKLDALDKRHDRSDEQLAYIHHNNAWLELSEPEAEEEEVEAPDD